MSDIYAENISVAYEDKVIINDLSVTIAKTKNHDNYRCQWLW